MASCATKVIARLQNVFIVINLGSGDSFYRYYFIFTLKKILRLVLVMIVGLPVSTPTELKNSAKYAFGNFVNSVFFLRVRTTAFALTQRSHPLAK
jgi:hypothetical protein